MNKKRVFVYVRVSTQEQAKDGYSIDEQIERLRNYCKAMGWIIVKIYTDAGFSGGDTDRPALQDMIEDVKDGKAESVLVYKLDRLSRSQKDTLELIEDVFLANNVDFVSMTENFDTGTSFGRAMVGILAVFAQLEREQIKERMSLGREGRAKDGKFRGGGNPPIGYDYINSELIVNEYEAMQIREMFDLFIGGMNYCKIEKCFMKKGYSHRYGKWDRSRIRSAISNRLYDGYVKYNGQFYKGIHVPIIDSETFAKAQDVVETCKQSTASVRNHSYLGGFLFCKRCTARYGTAKSGPYRYYCCHSRRRANWRMVKDPTCKNDNFREQNLDKIVFDEIRKLSLDPDYIPKIKEENFTEESAKKEKIIKKEISKIDAQKSRFMDLYGVGEFTIDEVQEKVAPLNDRRKKLVVELEALRTAEITVEEAQKLVASFEDAIAAGTFEEIRLLITSLISRIDIDGDQIDIRWRFA